jgi:hypothetical protein
VRDMAKSFRHVQEGGTGSAPPLVLITAAFSKLPLLTQLKSPIVVVTQLSPTQPIPQTISKVRLGGFYVQDFV